MMNHWLWRMVDQHFLNWCMGDGYDSCWKQDTWELQEKCFNTVVIWYYLHLNAGWGRVELMNNHFFCMLRLFYSISLQTEASAKFLSVTINLKKIQPWPHWRKFTSMSTCRGVKLNLGTRFWLRIVNLPVGKGIYKYCYSRNGLMRIGRNHKSPTSGTGLCLSLPLSSMFSHHFLPFIPADLDFVVRVLHSMK